MWAQTYGVQLSTATLCRAIARLRLPLQKKSLIASLSLVGMGAAMSLDGALDRESFHAYVEQALVPTLLPGQIVVLDNLAVHKSARAIAAIEAVGCSVIFLAALLPGHQPD